MVENKRFKRGDQAMRGILAAALVMLWPVCGAAQTFYKDEMSGCSVGTFKTDEGLSVRWTGPCVEGKAQGRGIAQWSIAGQPAGHGEGGYRAGLLDGRAIVTNKEYTRVEAEFVNGKINGRCVLLYRDGKKFNGQCADDQPNGTGRMTLASGELQIGTFRNGRQSGQGVALSADRSGQYFGNFVDDKSSGYGTRIFPDGSWYQGDFADGFFEGDGVAVSADGEYYRGHFKHGARDGEGEAVSSSSFYRGHWADNLPDGYGEWVLPNEVNAGEWHRGCLSTDDGRWATLGKTRADCGF